MSSVKVLQKVEKFNLKGESPLYLRIIKDRKPRYISLGIYLEPKHWDADKSKVKKSYPNSQRANNYIAHKLAQAEGVALDMVSKSKNIAPAKIKEAIMGKSSESFLKFAERYMRELEHKGKMGSLDKASAVISKMRVYIGKGDIFFDDITVNWLKSYESYLRTELDNSTNTIHSNLKVIRKLVNEAIAEDIFPAEKNPFLRFKLKWDQVKKEYLTEEELGKIESVPLVEFSVTLTT